jgi:hypothetical protein
MKKLLVFFLTLFLFSSVYAEVRVVDELEYRGGIAYAVGESEGFSGAWVNVGTNGNKASELNYKDGLQDGLTTRWFSNGAKGEEANYKDGKLHGTTTEWNTNGAIESKTNYKDGIKDGLSASWNSEGIKTEANYKNGKFIEPVVVDHTFYYLFLTLLFSTPLLFYYISGFRDPDPLNTTDSKLIWGITTLYAMTWIYPFVDPSSFNKYSAWVFLTLTITTPLLICSWVIYGISRLFKKRFKKR